jgi:4-carboxymuconolactone decarboxylase
VRSAHPTLSFYTLAVKKGIKMTNSSGQKAMDDLKAVAPEFAKLTQDLLFGDIWQRPELSQRDKSLITVTCLVALNRIEQVDFHLKKAFENGLTKEELVAAITHIAFYAGWPTAASGFIHLKKVIDQQ